MNLNLSLLNEICSAAGVSGYEIAIRQLIIKTIKPYVDNIEIDNMGNVIALKKGQSSEQRVMAAAHMDEIGFIVHHITPEGFLLFRPLGGFDPKTLTAQRVIVHGKKDLLGVMGSKPIHIMKAEERKQPAELANYFIDLGLPYDQVVSQVSIGDTVSRVGECVELGDCITSKSLDNRISVYVLIETLIGLTQRKRALPYDFFAVFTVQEEVGLRGAQVATLNLKPNYSFGLDTTVAADTPQTAKENYCTELGKGAAIKVLDSSVISDYRMVDYLQKVAIAGDIAWQKELLVAGGTDTAVLQKMVAGGSIAGAVSIPTRYIHQSVETCHQQDVVAAIELLISALIKIKSHSWQHR